MVRVKDPADPEIKPSNDGGGSVSPQGFDNIYEWMNAQVLTAPEITNPRW